MSNNMINFDIIGDLESCPCGSNKEFVNCCKKNISNSKSINTEFINDKQITNWMWKKYNSANVLTCLHPNQLECKKPISGAHALQENGVLSKLAVDNHVNIISYHLQAKKQNITFNAEEEIRNIRLNGSKRYKEELNELLRGMDENQLEILNLRIKGEVEICALKYKVEKKGKNEATKFTGFCNYHDTQIFMPIETHEYKEEIQQDFLFAYRAFAQEYHEKLKNDYKNTFKQNPSLYNETKFVLDYRYRQLDKYYMDKIKETFDKAIINEEYDLFETIRIKFPHPYDFAVTAMIAPEIDLNGNILNDVFSLDKNIRKSFYLTIFPSKNKTIILISWLKEDAIYFENYKGQLSKLSNNDLKRYLNNFIPTYTPNIVLSPRLWEKQSKIGKRQFVESFENISTEIENSKHEPLKLSEKRNEILKKFKNFLIEKEYDLFK